MILAIEAEPYTRNVRMFVYDFYDSARKLYTKKCILYAELGSISDTTSVFSISNTFFQKKRGFCILKYLL